MLPGWQLGIQVWTCFPPTCHPPFAHSKRSTRGRVALPRKVFSSSPQRERGAGVVNPLFHSVAGEEMERLLIQIAKGPVFLVRFAFGFTPLAFDGI